MKRLLRLWLLGAAWGLAALLCACQPLPPVAEQAAPDPLPAPAQFDPASVYDRVIYTSAGYVGVDHTSRDVRGGALDLRAYVLENSDNVLMGRYRPQAFALGATGPEAEDGEQLLLSRTFVSGGVISLWQPERGQWYVSDLTAGSYYSGAVFLDSPECSLFFYLPRTYRQIETGSLEYLPQQDGWLQVDYAQDGFELSLLSPWPGEDCITDFLLVNSGERLVDWAYGDAYGLWSAYTQSGEGRWCFDGYYWPTFDDYSPGGDNYYFRQPSSYLLGSMLAIANRHRLAADLSLAMLDTVALWQNEQGYFPSLFTSGWLSGDYGVEAGYFDTRWNSDLLRHYARGYGQTGADLCLAVMNRYVEYYLGFAQDNHRETANGGWLVADYAPSAPETPCHTSLNHQLAQILVLYELADVLVRDDLLALADRLLLGVVDTETEWLAADGDLVYGLNVDGSPVGEDYPYLTYNDLYEVQNLLLEVRGQRDPALDRLMRHKLTWMETHGVSGYKGQLSEEAAEREETLAE